MNGTPTASQPMVQTHGLTCLNRIAQLWQSMGLLLHRCAFAILIVVHATTGRAQPSITPGTRVRISIAPPAAVEAMQPAWRVGRFVSRTPTTFVIDTGVHPPIEIAIGTIRQIDVSRGRPNRKWTGAVLGGLLSGGAFVALACGFSNGSCNIGDNVGGFIAYYAVGAIPGAIVGGAIGSRHRGAERWQRVWGSP